MRKGKSPEEIEKIITKSELEELYLNQLLPLSQIAKKLNICNESCNKIIKFYNLSRDRGKVMSKLLTNNTKKLQFHNEIKSKIPRDLLYKYYVEEDHGYKESIKYFNIAQNQFDKLCINYNIRKDKSKINFKNLSNKYTQYGSKEKYFKHITQKQKETRIKNSGSIKESYNKGFIKIKNTLLKKYGVECLFNHPDLLNIKKKFSKPNNKFANLLNYYNIHYEREFNLHLKSFDFKCNNILIEINPSITHNINYNPYNKKDNYKGLDSNYHFNKTKLARDNNYRCINIWDWDDEEKIIKSLQPKQPIYARKCIIKEIKEKYIINNFENLYHFQCKCNNQKICLGLYYNDELIQIMTFGKPRYNKKYEYELLRLCTKFDYYVIGGAEKLFKYFINNYNPESIISYCDYSKFTGDVYIKLGMKLKRVTPSLHWYNPKTRIHIIDSLLRAKGFDKLLGNIYGCYGKGTSNKDLMLEHDFIEIYDAGQAVYTWIK